MSLSSNKKIKILLLAFDYRPKLGGVATCSFELANALSKLPHVEVKVLAPAYTSNDKFFQNDNYSCERIPLPKGAWTAVIPLTYYLLKFKDSYRPDAIISMLWFPEGLANVLSAVIFRTTPSFIFCHGVEILETKSTLKKLVRSKLAFIKKLVLKNATKTFAVSNFTKEKVILLCNVEPEKVLVVNNGVDLSTFLPAPPKQALLEKYKIQNNQAVFLTVTRLNDYKGVDYTLKSLPIVLKKFPDVKYLVGGIGPDLARLKSIVRNLELENNVIFIGKISEEEIVDHYNLADCFILNTRSDWISPNVEGFGIVFLEAAACEKPIIAGNSGGIPDAVSNMENGILVNPESPTEIAEAMMYYLKNPEIRQEFGKNGRTRIHKGFTWKHAAEKVLAEVLLHVRT
jgi:phosphatidylinositol alpha-1,6-mannosyltransferase